jgi:hypothetical protein
MHLRNVFNDDFHLSTFLLNQLLRYGFGIITAVILVIRKIQDNDALNYEANLYAWTRSCMQLGAIILYNVRVSVIHKLQR